MKTRLLKKLRKQAHDMYRIRPEMLADERYYVEKRTNNGWYCMYPDKKWTFERAVLQIESFRRGRFRMIAEELIAQRHYKERLKKVNEYENTVRY